MISVRVRGILFDFDGVLVDSEPTRFRAGAQVLEDIGVPLTWESFLTVWLGRTDQAGLRDILGDRYEAEGERVVARRNVLYEKWLDEVPPYPDAATLLGRLPNGIRLAVATGSRRIEVQRILTRLGLFQRFQAIITAEDYRRAKPAPDPFLAAARRMDLAPASCLVIEDSPAGVAAAHAAGMPVLAVDRGRVAAGLDKATWTVASLEELTVTDSGEVLVKE
ncbi:MAG: HAD family hydrolase [Candidatus Methylomirabilales bacterium]